MYAHTDVPNGTTFMKNGVEFTSNASHTIAHCDDIESACVAFGCKVMDTWDFDIDLKKLYPKLAELTCELGVSKPEKMWIIGNKYLKVPHLVVTWGDGVYVIAGVIM